MVVVVGVGRDALEVVRVRRLPPLGEKAEVLEDVVLGVGSNPCPEQATIVRASAWGETASRTFGATYRMSLYIDCIIRCSACRIATSRPLASQSHATVAGAWQIAQSGSILMTDLRDL